MDSSNRPLQHILSVGLILKTNAAYLRHFSFKIFYFIIPVYKCLTSVALCQQIWQSQWHRMIRVYFTFCLTWNAILKQCAVATWLGQITINSSTLSAQLTVHFQLYFESPNSLLQCQIYSQWIIYHCIFATHLTLLIWFSGDWLIISTYVGRGALIAPRINEPDNFVEMYSSDEGIYGFELVISDENSPSNTNFPGMYIAL